MPHPKSRKDHLRIDRTNDGGLAIYDETSDNGHLLNLTAATVYELVRLRLGPPSLWARQVVPAAS